MVKRTTGARENRLRFVRAFILTFSALALVPVCEEWRGGLWEILMRVAVLGALLYSGFEASEALRRGLG